MCKMLLVQKVMREDALIVQPVAVSSVFWQALVSLRVGYNETLTLHSETIALYSETLTLHSETIYRNPETLTWSVILFLIENKKAYISNNTQKITYKKMALTYR